MPNLIWSEKRSPYSDTQSIQSGVSGDACSQSRGDATDQQVARLVRERDCGVESPLRIKPWTSALRKIATMPRSTRVRRAGLAIALTPSA